MKHVRDGRFISSFSTPHIQVNLEPTGIMVERNGNIAPSRLEEIESATNCQKMNKTPGVDDVPVELIKWFMDHESYP